MAKPFSESWGLYAGWTKTNPLFCLRRLGIKMNRQVIMVLNDGETYTDLRGCKIIVINAGIEIDDENIKEAFAGNTDIGFITSEFG